MIHNILKDKPTKLFVTLGGFFIANALIAEVVGVKIFSFESTFGFTPLNFSLFGTSGLSLSLTAGVLLWPIVFIMTDIINEYYGIRGVKYLSFLTAALIAYTFIAFTGAINLTPPSWWINSNPIVPDLNKSYTAVLGQSNWIIVGSLIAFLFGQIVDVITFHSIKRITGEKKVWLRATGSTMVSQFIDSYVVLLVAFYWGADWGFMQVIAIGTVNYLYKCVMAIVLTPLIYLGHRLIENYLGPITSREMKFEAMRRN